MLDQEEQEARLHKSNWPICSMCCERVYNIKTCIKENQCNWCSSKLETGWYYFDEAWEGTGENYDLNSPVADKKTEKDADGNLIWESKFKKTNLSLEDGESIRATKEWIIINGTSIPRPTGISLKHRHDRGYPYQVLSYQRKGLNLYEPFKSSKIKRSIKEVVFRMEAKLREKLDPFPSELENFFELYKYNC